MAYGIQLGEGAGAGIGFLNSSSGENDQALAAGHRQATSSSSSIQQREFFFVGSRPSQAAAVEEAYYRSASTNVFASSSFQQRVDHLSPVETLFLGGRHAPDRSLPSTLNILDRSPAATTNRAELISDRYQEQQQHIASLWEASTSDARSSGGGGKHPIQQTSPLVAAIPEAQLLLPPSHHLQAIVPRNEFDDERNPSDAAAAHHHYRPHKVNAVDTGTSAAATAATASTACKECGNQAKKDCQYQRCRTCCKSRSFDCQTHIKSTWVPAAHRRNRDSSRSGTDAIDSSYEESGVPRSKRSRGSFRIAGSTASGSSSSQHDSETPHSAPSSRAPAAAAVFPPEVRAQAVFRCVRLTSVDDGEDEFAYQTSVKIGGHVFKGVLHDRGIDESVNFGNSTSGTSTSHHLGVAKSMAPSATVTGGDPGIAAATAATATLYGNVLLEEMRGGVGGSNW